MTDTVKIAVVSDAAPNAEKEWIVIDPSEAAVARYLAERGLLANGWQRTVEIFAAHVPAGHHLVAVMSPTPQRTVRRW